MMYSALVVNMIGAALLVMFCTGNLLGLPPYAFICLTTTLIDTLISAYTTLPAQVLFAKMIPLNVESSTFGMLTGLLNLANIFLNYEFSVAINAWFVGVTSTDFTNLFKIYCV